MGLLAEFVAADRAKALSFRGGNDAIPESHIRRYKGFTNIELGTLLDVLSNQPLYSSDDQEFPIEREEHGGEQLWTHVSPKLVVALAGVEESELKTIAQQWCESDELSHDTPDEMLPILLDLKSPCELAIAQKLPVYLWNCV